MKKVISIILILAMCLSLCACGNDKEAFEISKEAYDNIATAYKITEQFATDIYEAWRIGIYEKDEISIEHLAKTMGLTEEELDEGIVYTILTMAVDSSYDEASEEDKESLRGAGDFFFDMFKDDLFSACITVVTNAYTANGKISEAQAALDLAKGKMKEISEEYSDYEHYPNLKGYYSTTQSFFGLCQDPWGSSFEQYKTTINEYKNEARDYISDLDYIFED